MPMDHPRGCGENPVCRKSSRHVSGSPPRMRGKLIDFRVFLTFDGITPADAGKTIYHQVALCRRGDHPRGCGENFAGMDKPEGMTGSPPRMRGKPRPARLSRRWYRITPADAGKTGIFRPLPISGLGSPPRMRGKRASFSFNSLNLWITPADAGKTHTARLCDSPIKDHPRGCGENCLPVSTAG